MSVRDVTVDDLDRLLIDYHGPPEVGPVADTGQVTLLSMVMEVLHEPKNKDS